MSAAAPIAADPHRQSAAYRVFAGDLLEELDGCEATHDEGAQFHELLQAMRAQPSAFACADLSAPRRRNHHAPARTNIARRVDRILHNPNSSPHLPFRRVRRRYGAQPRAQSLRQIYAYLARTRDSLQAKRAIDGVILFPAIDASASQSIDLGGFPVRVIQLSLDQPWSALSKELMSVLFDR